MSAALRSNVSPRSRRQDRLTRQRQVEATWVEGTSALAPDRSFAPLTAIPDLPSQPEIQSPATVESLPLPTEMPLWLRAVTAVQQGTFFLSCGLAAAVLAAYAVNVYSQQSWGKVYQELQLLRRNERQLISANEILRNQLAQQADQASTGLVNPKPQHMIFLEPTPVTPVTVAGVDLLPMANQEEPIGY
ncbi:hypothetical protein [Trichothermofontia sp.]